MRNTQILIPILLGGLIYTRTRTDLQMQILQAAKVAKKIVYTIFLSLGVCLRMMPRAMPCTSVSMCNAHAGGAQSRCQKLCTAGLVGAQRTVQNNGNVRIEPNTWLVKNLQYVLSTFELFLVLFLLSWLLLRWTNFFAFFFSESPAVG